VEIPSERWSRDGENLVHTVDISLKEAIFGFSKTITHLSG
jgi:DnaJ-class molecular chaperone